MSITVTQAYRFALDPTPRQARDLLRHAGAARVAYNWGLARIKANLDQRVAERSYGIAKTDLTPVLGWSLYAMRKDWNQAKRQVAPWWAECSKEAYNTGLDRTTCGLVLDRDENAAINLASLVKHVVAGSGPETQNGRGADPKTRPVRAGGVKRPPRTGRSPSR